MTKCSLFYLQRKIIKISRKKSKSQFFSIDKAFRLNIIHGLDTNKTGERKQAVCWSVPPVQGMTGCFLETVVVEAGAEDQERRNTTAKKSKALQVPFKVTF